MKLKIKRRELLKLIPAIMGGTVILSADTIERKDLTVEPDCYVGLLEKPGFVSCKTHEVKGGSYIRQGVKWKFAITGGECKLYNITEISFPTATTAWGLLTQFALYNKLVGGVSLFKNTLNKAWFIQATDTVRFLPGDLIINL